VRAVRGYALVKGDQIGEGLSELREALDFYDRSQLRYTRGLFTLWLADGCVRQRNFDEAATLARDVLSTARELGYTHLQGVAQRILGEAVATHDVAQARGHLAAAEKLLGESAHATSSGRCGWRKRASDGPRPIAASWRKRSGSFEASEPWTSPRESSDSSSAAPRSPQS
jgi:hypothetical protein